LRSFVEAGGGFLGICAGAYYGAASVGFERGQPLEVTGSRELAFFPGSAEGPLYGLGRFRYDSEASGRAALVSFGDSQQHIYYNGGCYFVDADGIAPEVEVIGYYQDADIRPAAAIVGCRVCQGNVVLSGVHIDYRPETIKRLIPSAMHQLLDAANILRQNIMRKLLSWLLKPQSRHTFSDHQTFSSFHV
jgi:biotin--protein ligase